MLSISFENSRLAWIKILPEPGMESFHNAKNSSGDRYGENSSGDWYGVSAAFWGTLPPGSRFLDPAGATQDADPAQKDWKVFT